MKLKNETKKQNEMHWSARLVIQYGTRLSLCLLLLGFFFPRASFYAISCGQSAVYSFAISVIGGLFLDVIAARTGMRKQ